MSFHFVTETCSCLSFNSLSGQSPGIIHLTTIVKLGLSMASQCPQVTPNDHKILSAPANVYLGHTSPSLLLKTPYSPCQQTLNLLPVSFIVWKSQQISESLWNSTELLSLAHCHFTDACRSSICVYHTEINLDTTSSAINNPSFWLV